MCVDSVLCMTIFGQDSGDGERRHRAVGEDVEELESLEDELLSDWMDGHGEIDGRGFSSMVWSTPLDPTEYGSVRGL